MRFTFLIIAFITIVSGLDNGLGRTPPMGWNTWNHFQCQVNEQLLKDSADAMIELGFYKAGYKYLNLDDCWEGHRDENGYITTDPITFPGGIKALADYAHEKGLLFGIYSDAGRLTCARRIGSLGYEDKDAQRYAEWGVDFLKYDNCHNDGSPEIQRYVKMRDALNRTGRPIFYSICEWGKSKPFLWGRAVGNRYWRTTLDIRATWASIISIIQKQQMITKYAGPGGWNDPDMLQIGNGQLTLEEQRSHFSLWAALKSPLLLGFDIRNPPVEAKAIALNEEIIAINQDPLGLSVSIVQRTRFFDIWTGPLSDGYVAVLFNRGEIPVVITLYFASHCNLEGEIAVRDLWEHADKGNFTTRFVLLSNFLFVFFFF
ncbi:Glycoside Hydrolase Family 27 protein [Gigaspora rosea]|uniref:Alpha-galactosidase n=1 Tax=Gigaspora rosea TaxID=44941 RepID=A0A397W5F3_9GLOM|nr:Glycoside Hydrolase Family 27 protein [Gigaspora rosea]